MFTLSVLIGGILILCSLQDHSSCLVDARSASSSWFAGSKLLGGNQPSLSPSMAPSAFPRNSERKRSKANKRGSWAQSQANDASSTGRGSSMAFIRNTKKTGQPRRKDNTDHEDRLADGQTRRASKKRRTKEVRKNHKQIPSKSRGRTNTSPVQPQVDLQSPNGGKVGRQGSNKGLKKKQSTRNIPTRTRKTSHKVGTRQKPSKGTKIMKRRGVKVKQRPPSREAFQIQQHISKKKEKDNQHSKSARPPMRTKRTKKKRRAPKSRVVSESGNHTSMPSPSNVNNTIQKSEALVDRSDDNKTAFQSMTALSATVDGNGIQMSLPSGNNTHSKEKSVRWHATEQSVGPTSPASGDASAEGASDASNTDYETLPNDSPPDKKMATEDKDSLDFEGLEENREPTIARSDETLFNVTNAPTEARDRDGVVSTPIDKIQASTAKSGDTRTASDNEPDAPVVEASSTITVNEHAIDKVERETEERLTTNASRQLDNPTNTLLQKVVNNTRGGSQASGRPTSRETKVLGDKGGKGSDTILGEDLKDSTGRSEDDNQPTVPAWVQSRSSLEEIEDKDSDSLVSLVTWNLAEESPSEEDAAFIREFRKFGSDLVLISGQECENIKPRRTEGRRSREYRRLMIKMLGKKYVPIALHMLGGIQFGLFAKRTFLNEIEHVSIADVTCGIGNVFHNKGAIAAFVKVKARNQQAQTNSGNRRLSSLRMIFVASHMAAHVKNVDGRDADFWRIAKELEAQAPEGFLSKQHVDSGVDLDRSFLFDSVDRAFFCGDLNYRVDLPREEVEHTILNCDEETTWQKLLKHDQLLRTIAERRAFPDFAEGKLTFAPTFKFDKETHQYDTSHKQRIPAWTDRILFKPWGTRVLEYTSVPNALHSDHRPVHGTFRVNMEGQEVPANQKRRRRRGRKD